MKTLKNLKIGNQEFEKLKKRKIKNWKIKN